jgi:LPXTG-motif cell wall-anchored protein
MKRIAASLRVLAFSLLLGTTQLLARDKDDKIHKHANATQLAGLGLVGAVMIGGAGYMLLRRRTRLSK